MSYERSLGIPGPYQHDFPDGGSDVTVSVSANDATASYLATKLVAGTNITLTENNNGGNETLTIAAAGGVTGWVGSQHTTGINSTTNTSRLLVDAATSNADGILQAKGAGATLAQLPDGTVTGGDKRGEYATDWQKTRSVAARVASGQYSTIAGGRENQAAGLDSTVAGGRANLISAGTASTIAGGINNAVSEAYAFVGGGESNSVTNYWSSIVGGARNAVSANLSFLGGGSDNVVSGSYSAIVGGRYATATQHGMQSWASGRFHATGDVQREEYTLFGVTDDATPQALTSDGYFALQPQNIVPIPVGSTYVFTANIVARRGDADNEWAGWTLTGLVVNVSGTVQIVGTPVTQLLGDTSGGLWDVNAVANSSSDCLEIRVTGQAGKTILWGCDLRMMKVQRYSGVTYA